MSFSNPSARALTSLRRNSSTVRNVGSCGRTSRERGSLARSRRRRSALLLFGPCSSSPSPLSTSSSSSPSPPLLRILSAAAASTSLVFLCRSADVEEQPWQCRRESVRGGGGGQGEFLAAPSPPPFAVAACCGLLRPLSGSRHSKQSSGHAARTRALQVDEGGPAGSNGAPLRRARLSSVAATAAATTTSFSSSSPSPSSTSSFSSSPRPRPSDSATALQSLSPSSPPSSAARRQCLQTQGTVARSCGSRRCEKISERESRSRSRPVLAAVVVVAGASVGGNSSRLFIIAVVSSAVSLIDVALVIVVTSYLFLAVEEGGGGKTEGSARGVARGGAKLGRKRDAETKNRNIFFSLPLSFANKKQPALSQPFHPPPRAPCPFRIRIPPPPLSLPTLKALDKKKFEIKRKAKTLEERL